MTDDTGEIRFAVIAMNFMGQAEGRGRVVKIFVFLELESRYSGKHFSKVS